MTILKTRNTSKFNIIFQATEKLKKLKLSISKSLCVYIYIQNRD